MLTVVESWSDALGSRHAVDLYAAALGGRPDGVWAAPGRVNLIGEHVDYNAGLCLPLALPHAAFAAVRRREDQVVRVVSELNRHHVWQGQVADIQPGRGIPSWVAYIAGVAWASVQAGLSTGGFDVAVASCVPVGAGLSSSASVECATGIALDELFSWQLAADDDGRARLAALCVQAENDVAGAPTGGMDQAVSLRSSAGHAMELDCRDGAVRPVPFDLGASGLALLVIDTRASHALADGQYGRRRAACESAAQHLGVSSLREVTDQDDALSRLTDEWERRCVRHVVSEIGRVREVTTLLDAGRLKEIGPLLDASHASLRDDYGVSCPELDAAVAAAKSSGALGARMTGGGFGGSAIALAPVESIPAIQDAVAAAYAQQDWRPPQFLHATPCAPARRVS